MEKMTVNKYNYKEVADQVAEMLKEDKNAKIELVCGDKTYYPRAYRPLKGNDFILALCDIKNGFVPYEKGFDMKGEDYERIVLNGCPEDDFKYLPVLLRVAVSDVPENFKRYYHHILLAENGLKYTDDPCFEGFLRENTPEGYDMIGRFHYKREKGGFDFEAYLFGRKTAYLNDHPVFEGSVTGFHPTDEEIELALLETIDIFESRIEELKGE